MSKLRLSNSQIDTYTDCNRKWWLDKKKRLRPNWKASALLFGSSLDAAVENILLKKDGDYIHTFFKEMKEFDVNGSTKTLPRDILDVRFFASDVDTKLISPELVDTYCDENGLANIDMKEFIEFCKQQRKSKTALTKEEQKIFNYMALITLKRKGVMMLEKLAEWIEENVAEVHSVQKKISIENENGDMFIGYLDFIVTLKNGKKVLIDLKTSSNTNAYYPADSAANSRQLGIYSQEENIPDVAYLVADKKIRVREPRVRLAFIEGVITEEHLDDVFEEIEECTVEIKEKLKSVKDGTKTGEEAFKKNLDSCMKFGGCWAFNFCKKGCMKGLEFVK